MNNSLQLIDNALKELSRVPHQDGHIAVNKTSMTNLLLDLRNKVLVETSVETKQQPTQ
jgi:hypothetical protein